MRDGGGAWQRQTPGVRRGVWRARVLVYTPREAGAAGNRSGTAGFRELAPGPGRGGFIAATCSHLFLSTSYSNMFKAFSD